MLSMGGNGVESVDGRAGYDGGAVRVCDDALVLFTSPGVYLRHDEGHVGAKTERAGVVDKHGAGGLDIVDKALGNVILGRTENDVQPSSFLCTPRRRRGRLSPAGGITAREQSELAYGEAAPASIFIISCPTAPVAPRMPTLYFS